MKMRVLNGVLMLICVWIAAATAADAEDAVLGENGFARLEAGKAYVDLPSEKAVITILEQPYGESAHRFWGDTVEAAGGFWLPGPDGTREDGLRIAAAFNYLAVDGSTSFSSSLPLGFFAIDGYGDANGTLGLVNTAVIDTRYKQWGIDLTLGKKMAISEAASLSVYTGLTYFNTDLSNDFNLLEDGSPFPVYLKDNIETDYYGVLIGADAFVPLTSKLRLDFGGRLDLLYADAAMTAYQDLYPPVLSLQVDDSEDQIAGRIKAHLGLSYDLTPVVLGVGASAGYLSYQPYAEHATTPAEAYSPSSIEDGSMLCYKFGISMRICF
jgi:hypothetical protein